jgi:hypothetical protein
MHQHEDGGWQMPIKRNVVDGLCKIRLISRSRPSLAIRRSSPFAAAVSVASVLLLVGGCGWFQGPSQVDPVIIKEVRGIGVLKAETTSQSYVNGRTEITNVIVVDVGTMNSREALDKVVDGLRKLEWTIIAENRPIRVLMKSGKFPDAHASIAPFDPIYHKTEPEILKALAGESGEREALVSLNVYEYR